MINGLCTYGSWEDKETVMLLEYNKSSTTLDCDTFNLTAIAALAIGCFGIPRYWSSHVVFTNHRSLYEHTCFENNQLHPPPTISIEVEFDAAYSSVGMGFRCSED